MTTTVLHIDFKTLKQAYLEVKTFIEKHVGAEVLSLKTEIENDLGCVGDDNYGLLEKFVAKYNLDYKGFDYSKHFHSEWELLSSAALITTILNLLVSFSSWLIKAITFGKADFTKALLFPTHPRQTSDLTFGDMLTWYLTGTYCLRTDVRFRLINDM